MRKISHSTGDPTLNSTRIELLLAPSAQSLCQPTQSLHLLSLSCQLLSGKLILIASGPSAQLLDQNSSFSSAKWKSPLEGSALPLRYLSAMYSPKLEKLPLATLSLPLSHCFDLTEAPPASEIECSTDFLCLLQAPSTTSYNLLLRLQQPQLNLNRWLRLTRNDQCTFLEHSHHY